MADWQRRVHDAPARLAYRTMNIAPIRRYLTRRYQTAMERHLPRASPLAPPFAQVADGLARQGYFVTDLRTLALAEAADLLPATESIAKRYASAASRRQLHGANGNIVPPEAIFEDPTIFRWGVQEKLLDIIEAYLGLPTAYDGVQFVYSTSGATGISTERWHRDWECRRVIKVAVYCDDIDAGAGPFQLLTRDVPEHGDATGYRYQLFDDAKVAASFGERYLDDVVTFCGAAGTVVFADTGRFLHRGQSPRTGARKILFYSYFASPPRHPFFCERSGLSRSQIAELARGMAPRSRDATLWRQNVPALLQLIPTALL